MDYEYTPSEIGLKIKSVSSMAKCISIIRKYNPVSMSEIRGAIDNSNFIFSASVLNDSGIKKIRKCYDELVKVGCTVEIYENDEIISRDLISNLIDSHKQIEQEVQEQIDAEIAAEEAAEMHPTKTHRPIQEF